jgi:hypothetical protein
MTRAEQSDFKEADERYALCNILKADFDTEISQYVVNYDRSECIFAKMNVTIPVDKIIGKVGGAIYPSTLFTPRRDTPTSNDRMVFGRHTKHYQNS